MSESDYFSSHFLSCTSSVREWSEAVSLKVALFPNAWFWSVAVVFVVIQLFGGVSGIAGATVSL